MVPQNEFQGNFPVHEDYETPTREELLAEVQRLKDLYRDKTVNFAGKERSVVVLDNIGICRTCRDWKSCGIFQKHPRELYQKWHEEISQIIERLSQEESRTRVQSPQNLEHDYQGLRHYGYGSNIQGRHPQCLKTQRLVQEFLDQLAEDLTVG